MTEKPLKPGWKRVKFGEVVRLSKERSSDPLSDGYDRYLGLDHLEPGDLRIRRWGNVADGVTFTSVFKPGQVLFGKRRAYQRKVAVADFAGVCSGDIYVFESANPKVLLPELLPFLCQTDAFFEHAVGTSAGSLSPRTNWTSLADFEFALPPLEEQVEISLVLLEKESLIEEISIASKKAWQVRLSAHRDMMFHDDFPSSPQNWIRDTVGSALSICNSGRKPISADIRNKMNGEHPYYGPTGIIDGLNEFRFDGEYALIGEDGDHFLKNKIWSMTQLAVGKFNVNNHAHVIKGTSRCSAKWFYHFFMHKDIREHITKQGAARLKLKKSSLEAMPILVPPLDEQNYIVSVLESCIRGANSLAARKVAADDMKKELLTKLLGDV